MYKCRERVLPLLMHVVKFGAFRQNQICDRKNLKTNLPNFLTFDNWKVNKNRNVISDLKIVIYQHQIVLKTLNRFFLILRNISLIMPWEIYFRGSSSNAASTE